METYILAVPVATGDRFDAEVIEGNHFNNIDELKASPEFKALGENVIFRTLSEFMTDCNDTDDADIYFDIMDYWLTYITLG